MTEKRHILELTDNYAFTLLMKKVDQGQWEGRVIRFPHPKQETTSWGQDCGTICRAASQEDLKTQLYEIINKYK